MTNKLYDMKHIMTIIFESKNNTKDLQTKINNFDVLNSLIELEKLGFISRKRNATYDKLSQAQWEITDNGKFFLSIFDSLVGEDFSITMTVPPKFHNDIIKKFSYVKFTYQVFKEIIQSASHEIKIFSPYIDATFISLLEKANPRIIIKIITTISKYGNGKNPLLERLKTQNNIEVKYLSEYEGTNQIFQLHAKIFIIDNDKLYIGSANLKDTSLYYNLESGIVIKNKNVIHKYSEIFDYFYDVSR